MLKLSQMTYGQARVRGYTRSNWIRSQNIAATYKAKPMLHIRERIKAKAIKQECNHVAKVYARVDTRSAKGGVLNIDAHYFKVFKTRTEAETESLKMRDELEHAILKVFNKTDVENTGIEIEESKQTIGWTDIYGTYNRGKDTPKKLFLKGNKDLIYIDERKGEKTFNGLQDWLTWKQKKK